MNLEKTATWRNIARGALPWIAPVLFLIGGVSVGRAVGEYGFDAVLAVLENVGTRDYLRAALFAAGSYFTLTLLELLAVRAMTRSHLAYPKVALTSYIALSLGHTVGLAALSSGTVRYRFYSHFGLREVEVARVIVFSAMSVAVGLAGVAGAAALVRPDAVASLVRVAPWIVTTLGVFAWLAVVAYVATAWKAGGSVLLGGRRHPLPSARIAIAQVGLACLNFVLVAATLHALLGHAATLSLFSFASFYAVCNALSILSHVPGGFGVLEMVVTLAVPGAETLGALIVFRTVYYFVPFLIGVVAFGAFELTRRARPRVEQ